MMQCLFNRLMDWAASASAGAVEAALGILQVRCSLFQHLSPHRLSR